MSGYTFQKDLDGATLEHSQLEIQGPSGSALYSCTKIVPAASRNYAEIVLASILMTLGAVFAKKNTLH
ncbi:hypothetical protein AOLI_G00283350 [Acnodon oligacanthus]